MNESLRRDGYVREDFFDTMIETSQQADDNQRTQLQAVDIDEFLAAPYSTAHDR